MLHIDFNQREIIRYLLTIDSIDLYSKTNDGKTPCDYFGLDEEFKILLK